MNSETGDTRPATEDEEFDEVGNEELAETVVLPESQTTDNVGDASVEINVEQLIADIEDSADEASARKKEIRRRLEEVAEDNSFEDTYAIEFDNDESS